VERLFFQFSLFEREVWREAFLSEV